VGHHKAIIQGTPKRILGPEGKSVILEGGRCGGKWMGMGGGKGYISPDSAGTKGEKGKKL